MENSWFIKKVYEIATKHFHKWYGLACALLLLIIVSLLVYRLIPTGEVEFTKYGMGVGVVGVIIIVGWAVHVWRYPKRSRTRLGVAVAIQVEDLDVYKFLQKDFLTPFKSKINELNLPFDVLVLKNHQSERIETIDDARKVLKKNTSTFLHLGFYKETKECSCWRKVSVFSAWYRGS